MDDEISAEEAADQVSWQDGAGFALSGDDWAVVLSMLPAGWERKAHELGAVRRRLRGFEDVGSLLRVLLIHLADGCSLRETAVRASAGGLSAVSDVALLKRLRNCGLWFEWMIQQMAGEMALAADDGQLLAGRRVRLLDGTTVCEPGATGSTWRLHYSLNLRTLACEEVHVTPADVAESLTVFDVRAADVLMADRGFARRAGLRQVFQRGADILVRISLRSLPLRDHAGLPLPTLELLRTLPIGGCGEWMVHVPDDDGIMSVRLCAYRKTAAQTQAAVHAIRVEARKKGREPRAETLEAAGFVMVLTSLTQPSAAEVMEFYRRRWQVELAFKRLKSLLQLGHLKKFDPDGARAWLQGKLLVACLIDKLILTAERFSPWGYVITPSGFARPALAMA